MNAIKDFFSELAKLHWIFRVAISLLATLFLFVLSLLPASQARRAIQRSWCAEHRLELFESDIILCVDPKTRLVYRPPSTK